MRSSLILVLLLTGCASKPIVTAIERPVLIPGPTKYVPIPPGMLEGCVAPSPRGPTNGDLLIHDHAEAAYAACLQSQLTAIKELK